LACGARVPSTEPVAPISQSVIIDGQRLLTSPIERLLGPDEIACRYRAGRTGGEEVHWQILWLWTRTENSPASDLLEPLVRPTVGAANQPPRSVLVLG
jgi:hypothetical protein